LDGHPRGIDDISAVKRTLSHLILGQKGGQNRIQIIELLKERPYNLNQLAELLELNYRTVKHHVDVLLKNELVNTSRTGNYGKVYFLSPEVEGSMDVFRDIVKKFEASRKLADFAASPKFFQEVMEQTNVAIVITNREGEVFFFNKSAEELFGYKEDEVMFKSIEFLIDSKKQKSIMKKAEKGTGVVGLETTGKRKSGETMDISVTVDAILDDNSKVIGYSILSRDITERKRAQEALKLSEERYALAQRAANIGSWDWNIIDGDLKWSDAIEPMFGFGEGEFGGTYEDFLNSVHPDDRKFVIDSVNACLEKGKDYDIEHRIVWPDGTIRTVSETGNVIRDNKGKPMRMLGIVRDITERKQSRERIEYLNGLISAIKDISLLISREPDLDTLIQKSCEMLLDTRGYLDVSIALLDDEKGKMVTKGHCGKHHRRTWEIAPDGKGRAPKCVKQILKSAETMKIANTSKHCSKCGYCEHSDDHQTLVIPMASHGTVVGILLVCFVPGHRIGEDETRLLEEVADDLSFARTKMKTEKALHESEEKYRAAFDLSPDLLFRVDLEGRIIECNEIANNVLGYSDEELVGMHFSKIYAEESRPYAKKCFKEWLETGMLRNKRLRIVTKMGRKIDIELNVNTIYDSSGKAISSISRQRILDEKKPDA
jgi:PAS domain S-box-containing protein